ncbi:MAG: DUF1615 domain-containing protein [Aquincola tertiaricarbonis]
MQLTLPCRSSRRRGSARLAAPMGALACLALLAGCATPPAEQREAGLPPTQARQLVVQLLPAQLAGAQGWATDVVAALAALELPATPSNLCAALAVTEQESSYRADPPVAGLSGIAWREIERQAERAGVPMLLVRAALQVDSPNGKSYAERIDNARTERELSEIFEDLIGMVPLGRRFLAGRNPVRTGGPMQVSIAFAEAHAQQRTYPYPMAGSVRHEVFSRRGGLYFGIAHLLDYPTSYPQPLYRFADFNAGRHASRNAAFQNAVSKASGIPLALDGDLVRHGADADERPGSTELATRVLAGRLDMNHAAIRRDLERGDAPDFERSRLWERVFALAEKLEGQPLPRAVLPRIDLQSPKITRKLTTEWFARRVDERYRRCLQRANAASPD